MSDLIVIGGGLAGLSCAYRASRMGARVTVIDREDAGQATAAGAGILTPGTTRNAGDAWWQAFAFPAVRYYDELLGELAEDGETDTGHTRTGLLHVATTDEELARLPEVEATALRSRSLGAPLVDDVRLIDGAEARRLFPALGDVPGAVHVSGACRVDGRLLMGALRRAAVKRGARFLNEGAAAIKVSGGRVAGVELLGGRVETAAAVVVAAGAWSGGLLGQLGVSAPVSPQRGQIAHLRFHDLETGHWPTVMGFHSHYMLTFPGGRVVAGATREGDSGFEVRVTAGGAHEVLSEALRIAPGLARARVDEFRVGLRPATPDGKPVLGRTPVEGAYALTGHGPSGLQLAPYSGARVAELALGAADGAELEPFAVDRFRVEA
ncbi:MAG TPA: FAD-dependent oxidoreductase [Trueperaceae bacterium]